MVLYRISHGLWDVFAICDSDGNCQVLDMLVALGSGAKADASLSIKMTQLLKEWVPGRSDGPRTHNENIAKKLQGYVLEFKRGAKKGPKIRVLWFYGQSKQVICTYCFLKTNEVKQKDIKNTEDLRKAYFKDLASGDISVVGVRR